MEEEKIFFVSSGTTDGSFFDPNNYDDCAVCRLMLRAAKENREPMEQELLEAFAEVNKGKESQQW